MSVTIGRLNLKHASTQLEDRNIKRTATKVKHSNALVIVGLVQAIGQCGSGRLVDDAFHLQTSNLASLDGSLTLGVAEVSRHGDNRAVDGSTQVVLGGLFHLLQHHC